MHCFLLFLSIPAAFPFPRKVIPGVKGPMWRNSHASLCAGIKRETGMKLTPSLSRAVLAKKEGGAILPPFLFHSSPSPTHGATPLSGSLTVEMLFPGSGSSCWHEEKNAGKLYVPSMAWQHTGHYLDLFIAYLMQTQFFWHDK